MSEIEIVEQLKQMYEQIRTMDNILISCSVIVFAYIMYLILTRKSKKKEKCDGRNENN